MSGESQASSPRRSAVYGRRGLSSPPGWALRRTNLAQDLDCGSLGATSRRSHGAMYFSTKASFIFSSGHHLALICSLPG
jgi:hypothetical protein